MLYLTKDQQIILRSYGIQCADDINDLLLQLDALITQVGFDKNYELNNTGLELQNLYDKIYEQN